MSKTETALATERDHRGSLPDSSYSLPISRVTFFVFEKIFLWIERKVDPHEIINHCATAR